MQKAIVDLTDNELERMEKHYNNFKAAIGDASRSDLVERYRRKPGYAHYTFSGEIKDRFVELLGRWPTADEIIFLVDGGFSHFGAHCFIDDRGRFSGRVNVD